MSHPKQSLQIGFLNLEDDPGAVNPYDDAKWVPSDCRVILNVRSYGTEKSDSGAGEPIRGNILVEYDLPPGLNKTIGTIEDKERNGIVIFVYNSLLRHQILQYFPAEGEIGEIELAMEDELLDFTENMEIQGDIVDDLLYWTGGRGEPKKINLVKANNTSKNQVTRVFFNKFPEDVIGRLVSVTITKDGMPFASVAPLVSAVGADIENLAAFTRKYALDFNANPILFSGLEATACGNYVEITAKEPGEFVFTHVCSDTVPSGTVPCDTFSLAWNKYAGVDRYTLSQIKPPPLCTPTATLSNDENFLGSYIKRKLFQFCFQFVYDDFEVSPSGPFSNQVVDVESCVESDSNCIVVDFSDPKLTDPVFLSIIRKVRVLVRETNLGEWKFVEDIEMEDFYFDQTYKFFNNGIYQSISTTEADRPYSALPLQSAAQRHIYSNESYRMVHANVVEDFDSPCVDIDLEVDFTDESPVSSATGSVTFKIFVYSVYAGGASASVEYRKFQPIWVYDTNVGPVFGGMGRPATIVGADPFENTNGTAYRQNLYSGGFIPYSLGRPGWAVSVQNNFSVTKGGETIGPTLVEGDQNIYDGTEWGTSLFFKNRTHRSAIREGIEDGMIYSTVTLDNLEPGRHIIRMASHLCSEGDVGGLGDKYDLSNDSLEWQNTSTNLVMFNGVWGNHEVIIDIPPGGGKFVLGDAIVLDLTEPGIDKTEALTAYLVDNGGKDNTNGLLQQGLRLERQAIRVVEEGTVISSVEDWGTPSGLDPYIENLVRGRLFTDHNGYVFWSNKKLASRIFVGGYSTPGDGSNDPATPSLSSSTTSNLAFSGTPGLKWFDFSDNYYEGDLDGSLILGSGELNITNQEKQFIFYNQNLGGFDTLASVSTRITGKIESSAGENVNGVGVMYGNTGRVVYSDTDGNFSIQVLSDVVENKNNRGVNRVGSILTGERDQVILFYNELCTASFPGGDVHDGIIPQFETAQLYSLSRPLGVGPFLVDITVPETGTYLKRGGDYQYAMVFKDGGGRITTVATSERMALPVPFYTENLELVYPGKYTPTPGGTYILGRPVVSWKLNGDVPVPKVGRFTKYCFARTRNRAYKYWLQWVINDAKYVVRYDSDSGTLTETTYTSGIAKEVYISLKNIVYYQDENRDSRIAYKYVDGDRLRVISRANGSLAITGAGPHDVEIRGQITIAGVQYIVIPFQNDFPEMERGAFLEIYTPKSEEPEDFYYEVGPWYDINDPYGTPSYSVTSGTFSDGDTYYRRRSIPTRLTATSPRDYRYFIESESASDFFESDGYSRGRVNVFDGTRRQLTVPTRIRFGGAYIPETQVNNLSIYDALDYEDHNRKYGQIVTIAPVNDVLLFVHWYRIVSRRPGKLELYEASQGVLEARGDRVLGTTYELQGDYGSKNPESVVVNKGSVYGFDIHNGLVWRYNYNGIFPISSYKATRYFAELSDKLSRVLDVVKCYGAYDEYYDEYIMTFPGIEGRQMDQNGDEISNPSTIPSVTIAFHEKSNRWSSFYSFVPERYGIVGNTLVSFVRGRLWLHNRNELFNNFYGVQYPMEVEPVSNMDPAKEKFWLAVEVHSTFPWAAEAITNPEGQLATIALDEFVTRQAGTHVGPIKRDENSAVDYPKVNGNRLRSRILNIRMSSEYTEFHTINDIVVYMEPSERSNR